MAEDPLERRAREEREKKQKTPYIILALLAVVAIGLGIALSVVTRNNSSLVRELEAEKQELSEQFLALQADFDSLNTDYESISHQLDTSREQVALLIERLQNTDATNRAKIRQYEKELGTLRSIMRGYIVQIDSLNTLNKQLAAQAEDARREAAETRSANERLTSQVQDLTGQVSAGKVIKARGLNVKAYNASNKESDRSSRVKYMVANLALVENALAEHGPVTVYVVLKDPEGNVLTNGASTSFSSGGASLTATARRQVDYEGSEVEVSVYLKELGEFVKGIYSVEAYTTAGQIGHAEIMLR
jgi:chromosome segregation ATPase